jgi:hypothetical protein
LDQTQYHVVLDGETLGPYDTRTIIGMRVKKTLTDESVLIREDGRRFTAGEIVRASRGEFDPGKSGTHSLVKASFEAEITESARSSPLPRYEGPAEIRVQTDVLRIAGRLRGKDDRVKIPIADVLHARARESDVDLWLRGASGKPQLSTLRFASAESAKELVGWLPGATPPPAELTASRVPVPYGLVVGVAGTVLAIIAVVFVLAMKR